MAHIRFYYFFIRQLLLCTIFLVGCAKHDDGSDMDQEIQNGKYPVDAETPYFQNNSLAAGKKQLRLLAIGNSFSVDALHFVKDILSNMCIDSTTYSLYALIHENASLEYWSDMAKKDEIVTLNYMGGEQMAIERTTMLEALSQDWDVVMLTQYSFFSTDYNTFNPYLRQLIDFVLSHCANPNVTIAWQMAWSYNDAIVTPDSNYARWLYIAIATKKMKTNDGIDVIVPIGTAIQNARNTPLNSISQLTRDGWHLNEGKGRYIAACTVVQSLFGQVYDISVDNESTIISLPKASTQMFPPEGVSEEERNLCHQCVLNAVEQPFKVVK